MATFLFDEIVFGPVNSRRLGVSLGINLLPTDLKICTFDCVYCECGFNNPKGRSKLPKREMVKSELDRKLKKMQADGQLPDVITFAGNGEPTVHPDFLGVIKDTVELRDQYAPDCRIAVLSNATQLINQRVFDGLMLIEDRILKLDSGIEDTIHILNRPTTAFSVDKLMAGLKKFDGDFILQTLFTRGIYKDEPFDNTTKEEVTAWLELVKELMPKKVMIYTIARDTPINNIERVSIEELEKIGAQLKELGITVEISG